VPEVDGNFTRLGVGSLPREIIALAGELVSADLGHALDEADSSVLGLERLGGDCQVAVGELDGGDVTTVAREDGVGDEITKRGHDWNS